MSPRCPLSAFQGELLPAELLPVCQTQVFVGELSRFNMGECLNVVQLVGSHTGRCTSDSLISCTGARLIPLCPSDGYTHYALRQDILLQPVSKKTCANEINGMKCFRYQDIGCKCIGLLGWYHFIREVVVCLSTGD